MVNCSKLLVGIVVETTVNSYTGNVLYSDYATGLGEKNSFLNKCAKVPIIGIVAGVLRIVLGIIHTLGHLFAALFTQKRGHLYHAAKGLCEILRGSIEALPIMGRVFANLYNSSPALYSQNWEEGGRSWWMIKMYNPEKPDGLDKWMNLWMDYPAYYYVKV